MAGLFILAVFFAFLTLVILIIGVSTMAKDGEFKRKYGNKLMQARVACQFITVLLLILLAVVSANQ